MATQPAVISMAGRPMEHPETGNELPADLIEKLKAPLPAEAISANKRIKGLSSINAAFVIQRMNEVFGPGGYQEKYREISTSTKEVDWKERDESGELTGKTRKVTLHVGTVHGTLTIHKYGIHLENYGGSENEDLGDALKGACTDAFTKMCSHLGIGLTVYMSGREAGADNPACPTCGKMLRRNKEKDGWYCWTKKDGCGANFSDEGLKAAQASKSNGAGKASPPAKTPQSTQQQRPQSQAAAPGHAGKFPLKGTVSDRRSERKDGDNIFWLTVDGHQCATRQPAIMNELAKAFKGASVEMLVTKLSGEKGDIYQIREVIAVRPPQEGGRQ